MPIGRKGYLDELLHGVFGFVGYSSLGGESSPDSVLICISFLDFEKVFIY